MPSANYIAYTAPINPPGATPVLTRTHIWPLLQRKIARAQDFVGGALVATDVLARSTTDQGNPVTTREVTFAADKGGHKMREDCVEYYPMKVEFLQPNGGGRVQNIIGDGADGQLYMTYTFEWMHPELEGDEEGLKKKYEVERRMAKEAVDGTIKVMREMVADGRWQEKY
ncbi:hypothetical protein jhhlp_007807 [Lomentospora prolificans]|uniref:Uncharacterized protein n=1 Tax=Lomentospora prolificans TaxID=41688 RepID=A0A2N3N0M5_9PEZI|nr:hypothetical protein jhhlp_007807 [Lomentospora prolificans]